MGCKGSKNVSEPGADPDVKDAPEREDTSKPDVLRKEITEMYKIYCEKKEEIKPLLGEKAGLSGMLDEEKEKLMTLLSTKEKLLTQQAPLMKATWRQDAEEIYKAFGNFSMDKEKLISIIGSRTKWQLEEM